MYKKIDQRVMLSSPKFRTQKDYWMQTLASPPVTTDFFPLEQTVNRTPIEPAVLHFPLSDILNRNLMKLSNGADISIYIIFIAAVNALIFYYTGSRDVVLQTPVYKANVSKETLNACIWMRTRLDGEMTFKELILATRKTVLDAYKNQDYPLDDLEEQLRNRDQIPGGFIFSNVACTMPGIHHNSHTAMLTCGLIFSFQRNRGDTLLCRFQYDSRRYSKETAAPLPLHLLSLLENVTGDIDLKIAEISCLTAVEEKQLLQEFSHTGGGYPSRQTIVDMFTAQAAKTPHHPVCYRDGQYITYDELNNRSDILARIIEEL